MTLTAYVAALALLVTTGAAVVGAGLWLASRCADAARRAVPDLRRRKSYGGVR